jgi:hypothetical protein
VTKAKACKGVGQEWSPGVTFHARGKCRKMWGNEPAHSQMNSHFGSWSFDGFSNFQKAIVGSKLSNFQRAIVGVKTLEFSKGDCRGQNSQIFKGWL